MKLISLIHCEIVVYNVEWGHSRSGSASLGSKWGRNVVTMISCGPKVRPEFKSWPQLVAKQVKWGHPSTPERILFRLRYLIYDLIRYSGQNVVSSYICPTASFLLSHPIPFRSEKLHVINSSIQSACTNEVLQELLLRFRFNSSRAKWSHNFLKKLHQRLWKVYRAGPLLIAIIFLTGTKYDCDDNYYGN